jgi:hypothetical protein
MKKIIVLCLCIGVCFGVQAKKKNAKPTCTDTVQKEYRMVLDPAFAEEYEVCPVIVECEFLLYGIEQGYGAPKKMQDMLFFRCSRIGTIEAAGGQPVSQWNFFVMDKSNSELVFSLKKEDKLRVLGRTYVQNIPGLFTSGSKYVYFIADKIEIL